MKRLLTFIFFVLTTVLSGQYEIKIHANNFDGNSIIISYPNGERPVLLDTITGDSTGLFVFKGEKDLETGVYFVGIPRNKQMYKIIIKPNEDVFDIYYDFRRKSKVRVVGSIENKIYNNYIASIEKQKLRANILSRGNHLAELDSIHRIMNNKRLMIINSNPGTVVSALVKSESDWVDPKFNGLEGRELEEKLLDYRIKHYLDNLDLSNPVTFRLPSAHREIVNYFDKIVHLKPEIVNSTIDRLFSKMGFKSNMYRYYLPFFLKSYNRSYKGWFDEVYVHIARTYYTKEKAPWVQTNTLEYVQYKADNKENTLIGKIIPDITFTSQKGDSVRLLDVDSKFMLLVFWRPGCGHCRHAMPILNDILKKYKEKGVKLVTVCTRQRSDTYRCWDGVKKEKMGGFDYNLADKSGKTDFLRKFNVGGVPMIYILDRNKRIIDKNVKTKHLDQRLDEIIQKTN